MRLPLDIRDLVSSGSDLRVEREKPVRIAVFVDALAPEAAVEAMRAALLPQMSTAHLHIEAVTPGDVMVVDSLADVVIGVAGPTTALAQSLARARDQFVPTVVVALGEERGAVSHRLGHPLLDTVSSNDPQDLVRDLGKWLSDRVTGKRLALAANFAFVRRAVAEEAIKNTSFQNGVIGGVMVIPGADMPLMTANQAKMILQIAAAYGQPLGAERIKELAAVVGGAFALRAVARQLLVFIPGFGWALKAAIGYSGTIAMGYAALEYFEEGGDIRGLAARVKEARDKAVEAAQKRMGRGGAVDEGPIPAHAWVAEDVAAPAEVALPPADPEFELPTGETGQR